MSQSILRLASQKWIQEKLYFYQTRAKKSKNRQGKNTKQIQSLCLFSASTCVTQNIVTIK